MCAVHLRTTGQTQNFYLYRTRTNGTWIYLYKFFVIHAEWPAWPWAQARALVRTIDKRTGCYFQHLGWEVCSNTPFCMSQYRMRELGFFNLRWSSQKGRTTSLHFLVTGTAFADRSQNYTNTHSNFKWLCSSWLCLQDFGLDVLHLSFENCTTHAVAGPRTLLRRELHKSIFTVSIHHKMKCPWDAVCGT